jgi:hypothetical protein
MRLLVTTIRFVAVLAGLFLVLSSAMDVAGFIPHSNDIPPLRERVLSALAPSGFGLILLAPQRLFLAPLRFKLLLAAHLLLVGVAAYRSLQTVSLAWQGELDSVAIPVALIAVAIPTLSGIALWLRRQPGAPPNNSFKPNPLRGSA